MRDDRFEEEDRPATPPPPSKSQRKRDATALQDLGEQLVKQYYILFDVFVHIIGIDIRIAEIPRKNY